MTLRNMVVKRDKRCLITRFNAMECQVAHIIPKSVDQELAKNPDNCLLLANSLHYSFDRFHWTLDPYSHNSDGLQIICKPRIGNCLISGYRNQRVKVPEQCLPYVLQHYRVFLVKNFYTPLYKHRWQDQYLFTFFQSEPASGGEGGGGYRLRAIAGNRGDRYLLIWDGYPFSQKSWEPEENIEPSAISEYEDYSDPY